MDINLKDFAEKQWESEDRNRFKFYECPACGAKFFSREERSHCVYCGSGMIKPCWSESIKPDGIIPFAVDKEKAVDKIRNFCSGKKLLPKSITDLDFSRETMGVYVPVWVLNAKGKSRASFKAVKGESFKKGKTEGIKKDYYLLKREGEIFFEDNILKTDKTHGFIKDIEPYYFAEAKAFDSRYLEDFLCDKFDSDKDEACENVRSTIEKNLVSQYKNDISGFSNVQLESMDVSFDSQDLKYILVPVWLMNFKYEGEIHSFAVNGQTGSFTGKAPVGRSEYLKYFLLVFVIIAIIGVIIAFLT